MSLEQFWTILVKHWKLVVICFLAVGTGAYIGSKLITALYQSKAIVEIAIRSGSSVDYDSLLASNQLVQTEATLATSYPVLREVASHYPGLSAKQLSQEVTAAPITNTQLFEIDVQDPSPTQAAALTNDIVVTLISQQNLLMRGNMLLIAQSAQPSSTPVSPDRLIYTGAGLLTGLLLGILLALLFELLDTRARTHEALTQLLDWPVLATIWQAAPKEDVINPAGHVANVESYRILRTNIRFSGIDKPLHSLVVTSAMPYDGKSTIAANLAIFMARADKTTLLVDANLRHPAVHDLFGLSSDMMGLSNAVLACSTSKIPETPPLALSMSDMFALSSEERSNPSTNTNHRLQATALQQADGSTTSELSIEPFVHSVGIPNLWAMPSGPLPPNPPEMLDSKAMQCLLTAIANYGFEVVIFDTAPLLGLSDTSILASKVDGTLVVADITRANKKNLRHMKATLMQTDAHVLGCIVNKQRRHNDTSYSYYSYGINERKDRRSRSKKGSNSAA